MNPLSRPPRTGLIAYRITLQTTVMVLGRCMKLESRFNAAEHENNRYSNYVVEMAMANSASDERSIASQL
jgi:hypothetical protein